LIAIDKDEYTLYLKFIDIALFRARARAGARARLAGALENLIELAN